MDFMKKTTFLLAVFISFATITFQCSADQNGQAPAKTDQVKTLKVLAIGNSFSGNASRYLNDIIKAAGDCKMIFGHAMIGGCPLDKHYNLAMKNEENPEDPMGKPYKAGGKKLSLKEMLQSDKWDVVTIQQYSMYSFKPETYRPFSKDLYAYIKKYAPQAEVVFHQTWPYREDDPLFKDGFTREKMYQDLTKAYYSTAKEIGIKRVIPVGDAFKLASESPEGKFEKDPNFDYKNPEHPKLPDQAHSLNVGYSWKKDNKNPEAKPKLGYDGHHANMAGQFLGGCVWYEFLFGGDVTRNSFKPKEMSDEEAKFLRRIAHQIVTEGVKPQAWPLAKEEE